MKLTRSYVICCVQRTGSWLLAHTLADTGYAGRPSDYFDEAGGHTREWGLQAGQLTPLYPCHMGQGHDAERRARLEAYVRTH